VSYGPKELGLLGTDSAYTVLQAIQTLLRQSVVMPRQFKRLNLRSVKGRSGAERVTVPNIREEIWNEF